MADEKHNLITWLGFTTEPDFSKARLLGHAIGYGFVTLYVCVFLLLVGGLMWTITHVPDIIDDVIYATDPTEARWLLASLAALTAVTSAAVALPFTILKTIYNRRQTEVAEQTHITEQIREAAERLSANVEVKRQHRGANGKLSYRPIDANDENSAPNYSDPIYETVSEPNVEVRVSGLLALERVAQLHPEETKRIVEILCSFIKENCNTLARLRVDKELGEAKLGKKSVPLVPLREDIKVALRVLGRRPRTFSDITHKELDPPILEEVDFGGLDLMALPFDGIVFKRCNFNNAHMSIASLRGCSFKLCYFINSDFREAVLDGAYLEHIFAPKHIEIPPPRFSDASLIGCGLKYVQFSAKTIPFEVDVIERIFCDATCKPSETGDGTWSDMRETEGMQKHIGHWSQEELVSTYFSEDVSPFDQAWRAWQDEIGFDRRTNRLKGHSD